MSASFSELLRMSKRSITRLFVGAVVAIGLGLILGVAALSAALASDAIDLGGRWGVEVSGGAGAWTAFGLVIAGSLAILGGTVAAVVSWLAALWNTWQLEDKLWFASLLVLGLIGCGVFAMIAYAVAGPDGSIESAADPLIAGVARA
jgi:hypothetical protein